ncbi:maleylpyruvate isomerase family mycothiol-dependent enzyme [Actinokineospora iranica]|uniref:TIGR03083 family protein n=1 Tax=Actinokineospora iranica TaxID=1271860 RepID=A0A1G6QH32_9PSEU|nr:maleylpyruvate isomerase family mycothiol-dependent enzyme [Actinokineospora iranica]SDC91628.1 TIGR03083 family protein [Actinokineospora iranica]
MDYFAHLARDYARLRAVAAPALSAPVPTCPEWTVADLVRHVAVVYLHKAATMRLNAWPEPWPPDLSDTDPLRVLDAGHTELMDQLTSRPPTAETFTWYPPDQTVGFWIRRLTQETVVHRIDAELAAGVPSAPVPADLATDGVDEVVTRFLAFASAASPPRFATVEHLLDGRTVRVEAGASSWFVTLAAPIAVSFAGEPDATVRGEPDAVFRWLWRRSDATALTLDGDPALIDALHQVLGPATV